MHKKFSFLFLVPLIGIMQCALHAKVAPLISPRSASVDSALELVGWTDKINLRGYDCMYSTLAITGQYTKTFRTNKTILPCLFGSSLDCSKCDEPTLRISGKCRTDRHANDWLADYFGLPSDFSSEITFHPRVKTCSVDLNWYVGLDSWWKNAYFKIHAPIEHASYRLGMDETVIEEGSRAHDEGYFSDAFIPRSNLLETFTDFISKGKVPTLDGQIDINNTTPVTGNVTFAPLSCAKIASCKQLKKTKLSDIQCAFGWNFFQNCDYHVGILLRAAAPTGTRPDGQYLFEPIIGNGHHWELGGGITSHVIMWESDDQDRHLGLWMDANITHLFKTRQRRFFDLVNAGENSRYMLAEKMQQSVSNLFASTDRNGITPTPTAPIAQFARELRPVANLTCCDVDVSVNIQVDATAMFNYTTCNFSFDLGYNFWMRSCEKIRPHASCQCPLEKEPNTWVLKGDAHVIGFIPGTNGTNIPTGLAANDPIALSASDSAATIYNGSNVTFNQGCSSQSIAVPNDTKGNIKVDNSQFAFYTTTAPSTNHIMLGRNFDETSSNAQTRTSQDPIFLSAQDVDLCDAGTRGMSHKIFAHISYTFENCAYGKPYFGVGGKAEFAPQHGCSTVSTSGSCASIDNSCSSSSCDSCLKCNFSSWGIWAKGGISFD
jgi:hypothetical protein